MKSYFYNTGCHGTRLKYLSCKATFLCWAGPGLTAEAVKLRQIGAIKQQAVQLKGKATGVEDMSGLAGGLLRPDYMFTVPQQERK